MTEHWVCRDCIGHDNFEKFTVGLAGKTFCEICGKFGSQQQIHYVSEETFRAAVIRVCGEDGARYFHALDESEKKDETMKPGDHTRFGVIRDVLHTATVLHAGWEMDNEAWLVEMQDGSVRLLTTSHGGLYDMSIEGLQAAIEDTAESLQSLKGLLEKSLMQNLVREND